MQERTRLEELSMELPEQERKELLERIGKQPDDRQETEEVAAVEMNEDEREKIISAEMKKSRGWLRFQIWLRTFLTGKSKREAFIEVRLRGVRTHIRTTSPGLTGFETRDLTPKFARKLFDVYLRLLPLMGLYHILDSDKAVKGGAFGWYLESRWAAAKRTVEEFMSLSEMEDIFAQTGQADEIRRKLSLRLNEYVRSVPESLVLQLEEQVRLHVALGRLVAFPFAALFRYFGYMLADEEDGKHPVFEHAPVMLTLDLLERLHVTVSLLRRCGPDYLYAEEPVAYYFSARLGLKQADPKDKGKIDAELLRLRAEITAVAQEVEGFATSVPLLDLLRFFRRDPWLQLLISSPRLYLRSLYFSSLKSRMGQELEDKLGTIKERVIDRKIQEVLKGQQIVEFEYYRENPEFDFRTLDLPYFSCMRSLTLLNNYILQQFKGAVQEAAAIVASTALANNRIIQNRLTLSISGIEDLEARIRLFDRSLSPEEEDGKQLGRYRFNAATDLILQRSYRGFVAQKDKEARDLIDKAREYLVGVRRIFDEVRTATFESTRSLLKTLHQYRGRNLTLGQILNARGENIGSFLKLLDQLQEMEKGS
jgi:hypothetical protein